MSLDINVDAATNYCLLCPNHIACNNTGRFAPSCPSDAAIVKLAQSDINLIVTVHNQQRNKIAGGLVQGFKSATNMSLVVSPFLNLIKYQNFKKIIKFQAWDSELAQLAELNVRRCQMKHDICRSTTKYPFAGQNLAISGISNKYPAVSTVIVNNIISWFYEYTTANQSQMSACCQGSGHFTQLVQYRVVAIGCAISIYTDKGFKTDLMACNYSFGNLLGSPVYIAGPAASKCAKGTDSVYKNLCKI